MFINVGSSKLQALLRLLRLLQTSSPQFYIVSGWKFRAHLVKQLICNDKVVSERFFLQLIEVVHKDLS
jgi:hypothetical protein